MYVIILIYENVFINPKFPFLTFGPWAPLQWAILLDSVYLLLTYSMAQWPLKSFDRPLIRVSSSNSILV